MIVARLNSDFRKKKDKMPNQRMQFRHLVVIVEQ